MEKKNPPLEYNQYLSLLNATANPQLPATVAIPITDIQKYDQLVQLSEFCGIQVIETQNFDSPLYGHWDAAKNTIFMNASTPLEPRLENLCLNYCEALVENTSTQPADIKALEAQTIYCTVCEKLELPFDEWRVDRRQLLFERCNQNPRFNATETASRVQRMTDLVNKRFDASLAQASTAAQAPAHTVAPSPAATEVSANFMEGL